MLFTASYTLDYFSILGLTLVSRPGAGADGCPPVWSLRFGRGRAFRIGGRTGFATLDDLWRAWYCIQPVLEDAYGFARMLAEQSLAWSADERWRMEMWLFAQRSTSARRRTYAASDSLKLMWPWTLMHARNHRAVVVRVRGSWRPHALPKPHRPLTVSDEALLDTAWRERALVVGRFDSQCAARFAEALTSLIENAEALSLDTRIAKAGGSAGVAVVRKRL